jgi:hypothetical protein
MLAFTESSSKTFSAGLVPVMLMFASENFVEFTGKTI